MNAPTIESLIRTRLDNIEKHFDVRVLYAVESGSRAWPPVRFAELVASVAPDSTIRHEIDQLVARKSAGEELDDGPRNPVLHAFIEAEFTRLNARASALAKTQPDTSSLDAFFRQQLNEPPA